MLSEHSSFSSAHWFVFRNSILWIFYLTTVVTQDPVVNIPQGRIAGTKVYPENSLTPIEIYFGIPYATSPIGRYRFSAPERHAGWRRTYSAHRMHQRCPQVNNDNFGEIYSEDCLFLNIWTSRRVDGKSMPVVVILYSETWDRGGISLPCEELAAEGLVVVTVAYRLSVLSFFTLRSKSARGNLALLDQYMALLWIRDNISAFGGDPSAITLTGHSTGADSILYHIMSPRSTGLFQRAIMMSPRDIWKAVDEGKDKNASEIEQVSRKIARTLGCTRETDEEILHCMQDRPLSDILSVYSRLNLSKVYQPVPDDFLPISEQYLPISLTMALSATKQPILQLDLLMGTTELEDINHIDDTYLDLLNQSPTYISQYVNTKKIPEILKMFALNQSNTIPLLSQAVRWEYWNVKSSKDHEKGTIEAVEGLARMESSAKWSVGSALLAARLARKISRLYVYRFMQPSATDLRGRAINFTGAVHGADLIALLGDALMLQVARRHATQEEKRISSLFQQHIVKFIKFGSPGLESEWQRYKVGEAYVHGIHDNINTLSRARSVSQDTTFWLQYLPQLYNTLTSREHTAEHLITQQGGSRFRGGVFAMCGVSAMLLLLLCICAILLHKERTYRSSIANEIHH